MNLVAAAPVVYCKSALDKSKTVCGNVGVYKL